jgi:uncharacterized protein (DUF433 family)
MEQTIEQLRKLFPECDASQVTNLLCRFFPEADQTHVIGSFRSGFPELDATQIVGLIGKFFPELDATQIVGLIQKSFPSLNATQIFEMIRKLFPDLNAPQVIEVIQKSFPSLNATQIFEMIRELFPDLNAPQVIALIQKSFPSLNATQIFEMIRKLFPDLNAPQVLELIQKSFPSLSATQIFEMIRKLFGELKATGAVELVHKVLPGQRIKQEFPPSVKKGRQFDVPDGIIAHLTRECGGNVHDRHVVEVACGSFEKETYGANPHSGAYNNRVDRAAKNAADLETDSRFGSASREKKEDIPHTRNNWICYNFKERRIVPTHYTIRTHEHSLGSAHLKSWLVETSADGENWREVAREENNEELNGRYFSGTFAVADGGECRFIRLVNIGRNHAGNDSLDISAWEIFGSLIE